MHPEHDHPEDRRPDQYHHGKAQPHHDPGSTANKEVDNIEKPDRAIA
jgi:hypothetical protein